MILFKNIFILDYLILFKLENYEIIEGRPMNKASISMLISGIYAGVLGVFFLFFPEIILIIIGVTTPPDVISHVAGMIFLIFSYICASIFVFLF